MPLVFNGGRPVPKGGLVDKRKKGMSTASPNRVDLAQGVKVGSGSGIPGGGDLSNKSNRSGSSGRSGKAGKG